MKRLWIAVALIAATVLLCLGVQIYHQKQLDALENQLDTIETSCMSRDISKAISLSQQLAADYTHYAKRMSYFISHSTLMESQESVTLLPLRIRQNLTDDNDQNQPNLDDLRIEIQKLRLQLHYLRGINCPTPQNIL